MNEILQGASSVMIFCAVCDQEFMPVLDSLAVMVIPVTAGILP